MLLPLLLLPLLLLPLLLLPLFVCRCLSAVVCVLVSVFALLQCVLTTEQLEREYEKVSLVASKKVAARNRKVEIESELENVRKNISGLRMKLRELNLLHQ